MLSIKPKTAFTNILEGGLPLTAINGHYDRFTKTIISELPAVLHMFIRPYRFYDTYDSFSSNILLFSDKLILFVRS